MEKMVVHFKGIKYTISPAKNEGSYPFRSEVNNMFLGCYPTIEKAKEVAQDLINKIVA